MPSVPLDAIQQPAILYGADARIVAANERAEALAGRPLVGLSVAEKLAILETRRSDGSPIPVDDLPVLRALRGEAVVDEPLDITAADGRTAHILAAASPLRDNDAVTGALVVWQDVTALVAARGALRESEERLRSMAENVPSVLMRYDAAMRVVYLSPQAEHFTGIPTEQFIGRTNREVGMPGDLCDRWEAAIAGVFRTGMPADMEFSFPSPEGQRLFLLKFAPERGPDGAVQHVLGVSTEITERMKTGAALAQSRATLQAALGSMADAVFVSDADGRFVEFNDAFVAYHRFGSRDECSRTFETCSTLFDVWFGETGEPAPPERWAVPRALAGESGTGVEYMLRRRDTGETWIGQYNFAPLRDEDGVIFGSVVTARDITEQKRAERELAASEKKYRELFESMTEGFLLVEPILDEQGVPVSYRYLDANPALEHLTRLKRGDIIGRDVRDVLPGVEPYWIETFGRVALTGEPAHIEEYSRDLGGWYNVHVYSPRPGTAALIYTNITERKEAEEALQSALERQAFGQRAARSGFWDWDMQTETLDWSPEFYALFGLPPTAPASFETFQSVVHSDDRAAAMATIARSIEQHRPLENEYRIALSDGTERWIASYGDTTYDPDGRPVRMAGICVDVTERKWAEEGVRESEDRLARAQAIAHLGSWDWDVGSDRLVWSDEAYRIFGLQPEEIPAPRNEDFLAFVHPDDRARVAAAVQDALIDGQYDIEFRFVRKGGDVGYAHSQGAVSFANGAPVRMAGIVQDITEQKRAAEALQESEQRLRLATEAAKIGAFEWNIRTGVNIWTPELEAMYGLMPGEFGRTQPAWEHLVHPDDRAAAVATVDRALETGLTEEGEWRVVWRDGSVHWIIGRFQASRDADGTPLRLIGVNIDITGRKRAEEALRESEERFRVAQELSPDGFLIFRPLRDDTDVVTDFLWIYENDAAARMNDTNPGDVCGRRVSEILPHHDQSPFGKAYKDVAETGEVRVVEDASYDQDTFRQRRWFRAAAVPTTGGDVAVLVQDVTERRMAEAALHEAEERYRFALDAARFGTFDFRVDTGVVVWDERLKAIWGLAVDEDLDFAGVLGRVHPDDRERVQRLFAAALAPDSDGTYEADYRIILPDGSVRWTSARGRVHFRDVDGTRTAVRVVGIEHDITEQKEAEEALREYAENLARSNEDLERFAYVSSHDLQEPLRSIVSFSQLLERRYRGQLGQDADEYIDFIVEGGTRMQTLIQDLLAYSRVNTTRQQIARTDAEDVFAEAVRSLDVSLLEAEATLTHDPLPVVMADPIQLAQVLSNLISNAVKFRKPDVPLRVHVGARRLDGFWEFWVSDNGIGIEPEYFDRIFVIFQRLHTKETYPGTGIGLAIVKRIIDRHGGTVRVESTPGEGSTFFFTLPAA